MNNTISEIQIKYQPLAKEKRVKVTNSNQVYELLKQNWDLDTIELQEEFKILLLNRANEVLGIHTLSKGGLSACYVDIKLLFAVALKAAASGIILVHNHPSGNLKPSESDKTLCAKINKVANYLDIKVVDNMIITKERFYSFQDNRFV